MKRTCILVGALCLLTMAVLGCSKKGNSAEEEGTAVSTVKRHDVLISRSPAINATPFELEIGYATKAGFKAKFPNAKILQSIPNNINGGVHLQVDPAALGMDGLHDAVFSFDENNVLSCVVIVLDKNPNGIVEVLSQKYRLVNNKIDSFMNYGNAALEKGDSEVRVESEHLSNTMLVVYGAKKFLKEQDQAKAAESQKHEAEQKNKL